MNQAPVTHSTPLISCTGGCCGARALAQAYRRIAGCDGFLQLQALVEELLEGQQPAHDNFIKANASD